MTHKGRFITIEGIEGAGKTTAIKVIQGILQRANIATIITREPGGTALGDKIRHLVLHSGEPMGETAELLLLFAARAEHLARVIKPALEQGVWVLSDRFTDATYAYQGAGRGIPDEKIAFLENFVQEGLQPDRVIVLDISVEQSLARIQARGGLDRIEQESVAFFDRVRAKYLARAAANPTRYSVLDNSGSMSALERALEEQFLASYSQRDN